MATIDVAWSFSAHVEEVLNPSHVVGSVASDAAPPHRFVVLQRARAISRIVE
jgi:hypothetical protein